MKTVLIQLGFGQNTYDPCVFNRQVNGKQMTICLYVDDLLVSGPDKPSLDRFVAELRKEFKEVKVSEPNLFEYLGYEVDARGDEILVKKYCESSERCGSAKC